MTDQVFKEGMVFLSAGFPLVNFNIKLYREMLKEFEDDVFLEAVMDIVKNTTELYPGTNLIALIREKIREIKAQRYLKTEKQKEKQKILDWQNEQKQIVAS